jgi:hypothetical protein
VGDAILAHELAHVVQQRSAGEAAGELAVEPRGSPQEREAEDAAVGVVAALWAADRRGSRPLAERARPTLRSPRRLQRCGYTVERPPHTFKSCGFATLGGGPLRITNLPRTSNVLVASAPYGATGKVEIGGGTDAQAREWEAGFLQTLLSSDRRFNYFNSNRRVASLVAPVPTPTRDEAPVPPRPPWYNPNEVRRFTKTGSTEYVKLTDDPRWDVPWQTPATVPVPQGTLETSDGTDRFCLWMVARHTRTHDRVFLNWATWRVNWKAEYNFQSRTGLGTGDGTRTLDSGDGQGAHLPVLGGDSARDVAVRNARWVT